MNNAIIAAIVLIALAVVLWLTDLIYKTLVDDQIGPILKAAIICLLAGAMIILITLVAYIVGSYHVH